MPRCRADENPIDKQIGSLLRAHRRAVGMGQDELAAAVGVTFQQIQKYETGANRISASKLVDVARVLGIPVTALLGLANKPGDDVPSAEATLLSQFGRLQGAAEFMRAALAIQPKLRAQFFALATAFASSAVEGPPDA